MIGTRKIQCAGEDEEEKQERKSKERKGRRRKKRRRGEIREEIEARCRPEGDGTLGL